MTEVPEQPRPPEPRPESLPLIRELPSQVDPLVRMRTKGFIDTRRRYLGGREQIIHDPLTELPVYQGGMRNIILGEYTMYAENPEPGSAMLVYSDLDQLKRVNDVDSKEAGNQYIKWGAASVANGINNILVEHGHSKLNEGAQLAAMRATGAADETVTWLFGLDPETEAAVKEFLDSHSSGVDVQIEGKDGPQKFHCSSSTGYVSTSDPWYQETIAPGIGKISRIDRDGNLIVRGIGYGEGLQMMEERADNLAKETKVAKELERLPIEQFFQPGHIDEFIQLLVDDFGGGRISEHMLEIILKMQSVKTVLSVSPEMYEHALRQLGAEPEVIEAQIREAQTPQAKIERMVDVFRSMFGTAEDEI